MFGLMAIAQWLRLLMRPEVLVAGYPMPLWPSVLALVFLSGLSLWMWNPRAESDPMNDLASNKPLRPTRAAQPNCQRETPRSGPRG